MILSVFIFDWIAIGKVIFRSMFKIQSKIRIDISIYFLNGDNESRTKLNKLNWVFYVRWLAVALVCATNLVQNKMINIMMENAVAKWMELDEYSRDNKISQNQ